VLSYCYYSCDYYGVNTRTDPEFGGAYNFNAVADFYKHDHSPLSFVIFKDDRIVALRLVEDEHPNILARPAEVWFGDSPKSAAAWGNALANDTFQVPIFVKRRGRRNYTFVGDHKVLPREATSAELAKARATVTHTQGISRIVFLKRV